MSLDAKYVHTNLIARNWRALADFYTRVFGCTPVPPERDLSGPNLERGTGLPGAHLTGVHLRLPGQGADGPTLEIYSYTDLDKEGLGAGLLPGVNRPGFAHLAFQVPDVPAGRALVLAEGGTPVGEVVVTSIASGARVTWCYVRDPEGNILELQSWM
jgi:catechol 2,3-dioxygenase-like lactoylglutathione lyase family enzyme